MSLNIRKMLPGDAGDVASIHAESISSGFISGLSSSFRQKLYQEISKSRHAFGYVCEDCGDIQGFIAVSINTGKLFKELILKKGIVLALPLVRYIFSFNKLKRIAENMIYPIKHSNISNAEILAVAVSVDAKGRGIGGKLMMSAIDELKVNKIKSLKTVTDEKNEASNNYYKKYGFNFVGSIKHHNNRLNQYILEL